jgi:tetratricopeptide (TPR) repeat protein
VSWLRVMCTVIPTPDQRLRVFVSSTLGELADERQAVAQAISTLRLTAVMFDLGARSHPPQQVYRDYLLQCDVFIGLYWQRYGWVGPEMGISGLEEEFELSAALPRLLYVKTPAPDRDPRLDDLIARVETEALVSYQTFGSASELGKLVADDLAALLSVPFTAGRRPEDPVRRLAGIRGVRTGPAASRTLPANVASFTGRRDELARVMRTAPGHDVAEGVLSIDVIDGMAGVGKTALAVHAAHQLAPHFPDGQFFVHLHGHTPDRPPADPLDVLAALLFEDAVAPAQIPPGLEPRAALWRARMADRKALLVLDDASDSDQVRPLLPAGTGTLVLITSRHKLTALTEATALTLDVLDAPAAAKLFVRLAGRPGLSPDDDAVAELARLCACLPLAISVMAGQLRHHPAWTPADLAADLASVTDRTAAMAAERQSVASALDLSYRNLTPGLQRLLRRLSLHPGTDFDAYAAAALDDADLAGTRRRLDELFSYHLIKEPAKGRYRFHDLIKEHARALADDDPPAESRAATTRLLDYYLHTARAADRYLARMTRTGSPAAMTAPPAFAPDITTFHQATAWMDAEHLNLHAAAGYAATHDRPGHAIAIPAAVNAYLRSRGHWNEARELQDLALKLARATGNEAAEGAVITDIGHLHYTTGKLRSATAILTQAAELQRRLGDQLGEANAVRWLGVARLATGDYRAAAASIRSAQALYNDLGDRLGMAAVVYDLGVLQYQAAQYRDSAVSHAAVLEAYRALGVAVGQADALSYLGAAQRATGHYDSAAASLRQALQIYRQIGDRREEAGALYFLGAVQREAGDLDTAAGNLRQALQIYRDIGDRFDEAGVLNELGILDRIIGDYQTAAASLARALRIYRDSDSRNGQAEVLDSMGELALATGRLQDAASHHQEALAMAIQTGDPLEEARAREGLGRYYLSTGQPVPGNESLRRALTIYRRIGSPRATRVENLLSRPPSQDAP